MLHNTCLGGRWLKEQFGLSKRKAECRQAANSTLGLPQVRSHYVLNPTAMQREASVAAGERLSKATSQHHFCPQLPSSRKSLSRRGAISSHITYGPTCSPTQDMLTKQETWVLAIPLGSIRSGSKLRKVSGSSCLLTRLYLLWVQASTPLYAGSQHPAATTTVSNQRSPSIHMQNNFEHSSGRVWWSQMFPAIMGDGVRDHLSE